MRHLTNSQLKQLASTPDPTKNLDTSNPSSHLTKILIPRAPNTANNTFVKNYIVSTLGVLKWHIEEDRFHANTPYGQKEFTNVIATKDPHASRRLILSAHFDSKYFPKFPENQFVGATDSAAPCALLLDLAEALDPWLEYHKQVKGSEHLDDDDDDTADTTLQLVFFDGEEAFKDWTETDSVYGARHLAEKWASTYLPPDTHHGFRRAGNMLSNIEHLVLLDLLGAPRPLVRSYYPSTAWLFDELVSAEHRLGAEGIFNEPSRVWTLQGDSFFLPRTFKDQKYFGFIDDDHMPFLKRGVNVLHVITEPFPRVWHTLADDATALDLPTLKHWNIIFRVFIAEYFGLKPPPSKAGRSNGEL